MMSGSQVTALSVIIGKSYINGLFKICFAKYNMGQILELSQRARSNKWPLGYGFRFWVHCG